MKCGNCKEEHLHVADVKACYDNSREARAMATPRSDLSEPPRPEPEQPHVPPRSAADRSVASEVGSYGQHASVRVAAPEGVYVYDSHVYKVRIAVHGSGRPYASVLTEDGWEMARGMVFELDESMRITEEQAEQYGSLYGRCVICGRTLTKEQSIARSMGDKCASRMGW